MIDLKINDPRNPVDAFNRITYDLFNKTVLKINEFEYSFFDIEFYYNHPSHQDGYALEHTIQTGQLRAHQFGIDISLGHGENFWGGILIRGLILNDIIYKKSSVKGQIMNSFRMGKNEMELIPKLDTKLDFFRSVRSKLGKPDNNTKMPEMFAAKYRYVIKDSKYLVNGKEELLAKSDLPLEIQDQLRGYKLKS